MSLANRRLISSQIVCPWTNDLFVDFLISTHHPTKSISCNGEDGVSENFQPLSDQHIFVGYFPITKRPCQVFFLFCFSCHNGAPTLSFFSFSKVCGIHDQMNRSWVMDFVGWCVLIKKSTNRSFVHGQTI